MWVVSSFLLFFIILMFGLVGIIIIRLITRLFEEDLRDLDSEQKLEFQKELGREDVTDWT